MRSGYATAVPVTEEPASPAYRSIQRENYRVLQEIERAARRGDAQLVKRLANLLFTAQ